MEVLRRRGHSRILANSIYQEVRTVCARVSFFSLRSSDMQYRSLGHWRAPPHAHELDQMGLADCLPQVPWRRLVRCALAVVSRSPDVYCLSVLMSLLACCRSCNAAGIANIEDTPKGIYITIVDNGADTVARRHERERLEKAGMLEFLQCARDQHANRRRKLF